jgi:hypothetical protein
MARHLLHIVDYNQSGSLQGGARIAEGECTIEGVKIEETGQAVGESRSPAEMISA